MRAHRDPSSARKALTLAVLILTGDQVAQCQRWCSENRASSEWGAVAQELRDAIAAREGER